MDTTASSFTLRKNAKRAAEAMIRKGTAPAVDYGIYTDRRHSARFSTGRVGLARRVQRLDRTGVTGSAR